MEPAGSIVQGNVSMRSGHINYNNYCSAFDQRNGFGTSTDAKSTNPIIVRFFSQEVRNDIIMRLKVLKGTKQSIVEDLTALNGATLNRLHKNPRIDKCWSWNGRLFASTKDGHTLGETFSVNSGLSGTRLTLRACHDINMDPYINV